MHTSFTLAIAGLAGSAMAGYTLQEDFMSGNFFDHFDFFNSADPTHGFVNYVDSATANSQGYVNTDKGAYIGVDHTNVASSAGRNSVRLQSKSQTTEALIILDLAHMPGGVQGTWPAFWTVGPDWPNNGEVDIIEGVNNQNTNFMTIHSGSQACQMSSTGASALSLFTSDCWNVVDGNVGCSYHDNNQDTYGDAFNAQGGGVFAMEHAGDKISIWHFARSDDLSQVLSDNPDPKSWPAPRAQWLSTSNQFGTCDLSTAVQQQSIVFDTTFCGDWAGAAFDGGLDACNSFVQNNPSAFQNAYWQVNSLKVFTSNGQSSPAPVSSSAIASSSAVVSSAATSQSAPITTDSSTSAAATTLPNTTPSSSEPTTSSVPAVSTESASTESTIQSSVTVASSTTSAVPTTTSAPAVPMPSAPGSGRHHHHSKHVHDSSAASVAQAPTSTVQLAPVTALQSAATATASDVPEDVVAGSDQFAQEIPDSDEHTRRSTLVRRHVRQFTNFRH